MLHQPRKRFGQHFLIDASVLQAIVDALALQSTDNVVEIGPGLGALTADLLTKLNQLTVIEIDRDLAQQMKKKFEPSKLTVYNEDALSFNFSTLSQKPGDMRVVGNLPYNISTPLLFHLFDHQECIRDMHFMLQKEVVLRLTADIGSADYGRLSVMSQYFCDNILLFLVDADAFDPPPKVESAVVQLIPKKNLPLSPVEFTIFANVVKEAFNYRRKKLSNSIKRLIDSETLIALGIDPNTRPQDTSVAEYCRIAQAISLK